MTKLLITPSKAPLKGSLPGPPDQSCARLSLLLAALAPTGTRSRIIGRGLSLGRTCCWLSALGVEIHQHDDYCEVVSRSWVAAETPLDVGDSELDLAMACGLAVTLPFSSLVTGGSALMRRSLKAIMDPLRLRGAHIEGRLDPGRPTEVDGPVEILVAGQGLSELRYDLGPAHHVGPKTAALISGLLAFGDTTLAAPLASDDRLERLLISLGTTVRSAAGAICLRGPIDRRGWAINTPVASDTALCVVLLSAALMVPLSWVETRDANMSLTRNGPLEVLRDAGLPLSREPKSGRMGAGAADLRLLHAAPRPLTMAGELTRRCTGSVLTLAAVASQAVGKSRFYDLPTDVLASAARLLPAFGIDVFGEGSTLCISGGEVRAAVFEAHTSSEVLAAMLLALAADGPSEIGNAQCVMESFPRSVGSLRALGANITVRADSAV